MINVFWINKLCARQPNIKLFTKNIDFLAAFFQMATELWQQKM